jgi:hypothetical protein
MATKKKSKGVLERIGDAVTTGAEVVIDAGAKAVHAVGDMLPTGKSAPKRGKSTKAAAKTKAPKAALKRNQSTSAKTKPKAPAAKPKTKASPATPKAAGSKKKAPASKKA